MVDWGTVATSVVAAGGGGAAIAFGIFRGLGTKWIDGRFAKQLEQSRQVHVTETEHLRFKIAQLLDRTTKLNQREFEVLPDVWEKAGAAYAATAYLLNSFRTYPDFSRMSEAYFDEFMAECEIPEFRKAELKDLSGWDRTSKYSETMRWMDLNKAKSASREFSTSLSRSSIYLHPDTHSRLKEFETRVAHAIFDRDFKMQNPREPGDPPLQDDDAKAFGKQGQEWFTELGDYLRSRYWGEGAASR